MASTTAKKSVASIEMCFFCFDVLTAHLDGLVAPKNPPFPDEPHPLFVTWTLGKEKKLRGCIGTFEPLSLHNGLKNYAIQSATKDSRFSPINRREMKDLYVSVSILTRFEKAKDYLDWTLGVHGIKIEFSTDRGSRDTATFLPEVAREQGWDHIRTIDALLRKGGFRGDITPKVRESINVTRYQSEKLTASYSDYHERRNQLAQS